MPNLTLCTSSAYLIPAALRAELRARLSASGIYLCDRADDAALRLVLTDTAPHGMCRTQAVQALEGKLRRLPCCGSVSVSGRPCGSGAALCLRLDADGASSLLRRNSGAFARALTQAATECLALPLCAPRAAQPCTVCRSAALRHYPCGTARAYGLLPSGSYVSLLNTHGTWAIVSTGTLVGFFPAEALQFL